MPSGPYTVHTPSLAYASTSFAATLIDSICKFYYVKIFLLHYKVSDYWFNIAQVIFMIWNAVNDPLFGYIQDNSNSRIFRVRRLSIQYGAPLFVISFITFWIPWATDGSWVVGLHLIMSLCLYDTLFTFVLLAQCALFAEMSIKHEDRLRLVYYGQIASLLGSWSVAACEFFSSSLSDFTSFQFATVVFALISWFGFHCTGKYAVTEVAQLRNIKLSPAAEINQHNAVAREKGAFHSIMKQTLEILQQKNFLAFVFMNFLQIFNLFFHANFASIFLDVILPSSFPSFHRTLFNGSLFILPQVLVLCLGPWLQKRGAYWVVMNSFYVKLLSSTSLGVVLNFNLVSELNLAFIIMVFIMVDYALCSAVFGTFNLLVSDIIDDDMLNFKRSSPLSSSIFGTNALITKPAISLAPMLIVYLLNPYGFQSFKSNPKYFLTNQVLLNPLKSAVMTLIWTWPFFVALLQILVFRPYSLRCSHNLVSKHVET